MASLSEAGDEKTFSYAESYLEVNKLANAIKSLGIKKGDRVAIYMPMVPEAVFAMLACSRIGAPFESQSRAVVVRSTSRTARMHSRTAS